MSIPGGGGDSQSLAVVPDKVREVGNYVYGIADDLRRALESAGREVDSCVGSSWTGDAANTFTAGWEESRTGGVTVITALTEMTEKLGVTAETYSRKDDSNAAALGSFSLDLPGL
ncbi:WXG100 family type VII secretion target [Nocardia sp. NPDC059177]|uniref:WXG100 family type VII secretion target n=1 Tax=Nocardia sp. NPDC059177 TaxID=3346759 RepID=UPI0036B8BFC3